MTFYKSGNVTKPEKAMSQRASLVPFPTSVSPASPCGRHQETEGGETPIPPLTEELELWSPQTETPGLGTQPMRQAETRRGAQPSSTTGRGRLSRPCLPGSDSWSQAGFVGELRSKGRGWPMSRWIH